MTVTINGTSGIAGTNGSAGTPAVQGEDTNTGIFFPAADTVGVATAGTERLRVDSSGNVGIGVTPSYKLDVFGSVRLKTGATGTPVIISTGSDSQGTLRFGSASTEYSINGGADYLALVFNTNSAERMRIDSSGNVGIGTSSPTGALHVSRSGLEAGITLERTTSATAKYTIAANDGNLTFTNSATGSERARIDSSGYLLVGVTSHINGHTFKSSDGAATYRPTVNAGFGIHHFYSDFGSTQSLRAYFTANGGLSNFSANNVNLSDERVKTDIFPVGSYWDKVKALQVVTYKYRDQGGGEDNIGVIAQQVESVAPEFVCTSGFGETPEDGIPLKSIYETDMHYATLKALQEAMARIETLEAKVNELEAK